MDIRFLWKEWCKSWKKLQYFAYLMWRVDSLEKTLMLGEIGGEEKGTTEDEMAGWHHWLDAGESEWTPGIGDGQGGLACCDSWGRKESDMTERLNWTELKIDRFEIYWKWIISPSYIYLRGFSNFLERKVGNSYFIASYIYRFSLTIETYVVPFNILRSIISITSFFFNVLN